MLYFAYGSNMNHRQMTMRCPGYKFVGAACLEGHKFVYDGYFDPLFGAVANIVQRSKDDVVWGGLFEITGAHLKTLDEYEQYPYSYGRKTVNVITMEGDLVEAIAYFREGEDEHDPTAEYRDILTEGARDCGLPASYIKNAIMGGAR